MAKATYKDSGVDLDVYQESMSRVGAILKRSTSPRVMPLAGGFAGLFQLDFESQLFARNYEKPVLVSCGDGVGTKLKVATMTGIHDTVGIDLVAMSINDALCCGAEPLFFLDYIAMSKDDPALTEALVKGISDGCVDSDCALLGGETAIMPDIYQPGEYDLAGFCVGVVEKKRVIDGKSIAAGDKLIGIASSGLHSNGFSLVRRVVFDIANQNIEKHVDELGTTVGEALLTPTRIYSSSVTSVLANYQKKNVVHGIAHITGGGLHENLERILPKNVNASIIKDSWDVPPIFPWLQKLGDIEPDEMDRVFNMGLGLVMVVSDYYAESVKAQIEDLGISAFHIGEITTGEGKVSWAS